MSAKYFPNLFQPYAPLCGKDWIRKLDPEAFAVFVDIGLKAAEHGRLGGQALPGGEDGEREKYRKAWFMEVSESCACD